MENCSPAQSVDTALRLLAARDLPRTRAALTALAAGVAVGFLYHLLGLDFTPRPSLLANLAAATIAVTVAHEGVHGLAGAAFGHRPLFGLKPPFVFTTFKTLIPRGRLALIALAPLVVVDAAAAALFLTGLAPVFSALCFGLNTLGSVGDVWMVAVLLAAPRDSMVKDTVTGLEIYSRQGAAGESTS